MKIRTFRQSQLRESEDLFKGSYEISRAIVDHLSKNNKRKNLQIQASLNGLSLEIFLFSGKKKISTSIIDLNSSLLEQIDELGGIDIDITVKTGNKFDADGEYTYDKDSGDLGAINVIMTIPPEYLSTKIDQIERILRGHIAHEIQHAKQRIFMRRKHSEIAGRNLRDHLMDSDEIDARIEEILVMMNSFDELSRDKFIFHLEQYIDEYFERTKFPDNEKSHPYGIMRDKHVKFFDKKFLEK